MSGRVPAGWALAALVVFAFVAIERAGAPADAGELLLASSLSRAARFQVQPGDDILRLDTWIVLDGPTPGPRDTFLYELEVTLRDATGEELWRTSTWVRSRTSSAGGADEPLRPSAHLLDRPLRTVLDGRTTVLDLPESGGVAEVGIARGPAGADAYVVAWTEDERAAWKPSLGESPAGELAWFHPLGAAGLPRAWADEQRDRTWERLAPLPLPEGGLAPVESLALRGGGPGWEQAAAEGVLLAPGGAASFGLDGTGVLHVEWWTPDGREGAPAPFVTRELRRDGGAEDGADASGSALDLPFGPDTLAIEVALTANEPRRLRAWLRADAPDASYGRPALLPEPSGRQRVGPELRTLTAWRIGRDGALEFDAAGGELLAVTSRPRLGPGSRPGLSPGVPEPCAPVSVEALTADGRQLAAYTFAASAVPSSYERFTEAADPADRVPEPQRVHLLAPAGTAILRISSEGLADVSVAARSSSGDPPLPRDYALPGEVAQRWIPRYAPELDDPWLDRPPRDAEGLIREGRMVRIDAQVRFQSRGTPEAGERPWYPLPQAGAFEILARRDSDGSPSASPASRLSGTPARLATPEGVLAIDYRVDHALVGTDAHLLVDGDPVTLPLVSAGGRLVLEGLDAEASVAITEEGLFLARAAGGEAWELRKARRAYPGEPLHVRLPPAATRVLVQLWSAGRPATVAWSLDGQAGFSEREPRPAGEHVAEPVGPYAETLSDDLGRVSELRGLSLPSTGGGALTLEVESGAPVLLRVLTDVPAPEGEATRWWRSSR